jgi:hypothetical protein
MDTVPLAVAQQLAAALNRLLLSPDCNLDEMEGETIDACDNARFALRAYAARTGEPLPSDEQETHHAHDA